MNCESLEELICTFNDKIGNLNLLLDLRYAEDSNYESHVQSLDVELDNMETVLTLLKLEVANQRQKFQEVQEAKVSLESLIFNLRDALSNIPVHMPRPVQKDDSDERNKSCGKVTEVKGRKANPEPFKENHPPKTKKSGTKKQKKNVYIPTVDYVTVEEFEAVPKYMKGRLTYNQVNSSVDELNKAFKEKYKIMGLTITSMSDVNRKRFDKFQQQETKDTKDEYFVVRDDIKEFSNLKMDNVSHSLLTILRHCGRIKEIRGGGNTRYAACTNVY